MCTKCNRVFLNVLVHLCATHKNSGSARDKIFVGGATEFTCENFPESTRMAS